MPSTRPLDSSTLRGKSHLRPMTPRKVVEVIGTVENNGSITLQYAAGYNKLVEYMNGKFHGEVF